LDVGLGIIGNPELLFLDEPTSGLDPAARRTTWTLIRTLSSEGTTVVLTSHFMDEVEALAHRVAVLAGGRIVATGPPSSLGGRDHGQVTIRFALPVGVAAEDLPVPPTRLAAGIVEIQTEDEQGVITRITSWAHDRSVAIVGLTVTRETLEDVYLELTKAPTDAMTAKRP
jgi:ABC-2 type transport system ATP-binding protein